MSSKIVHYKRYIAGWLNSSIHDYLEDRRPRGESTKYALITCLDSDLDPASLRLRSPSLNSLADAVMLGKGLLLPTEVLLRADSTTQLFFGFDEVWFFPHKPLSPKPKSAWIVGPAKLNQAKLSRLGKWMSENHCSLALGDGNGLNFIMKAEGLVRDMLSHSIDQPKGDAIEAAATSSA
jgi:hypothetical protein